MKVGTVFSLKTSKLDLFPNAKSLYFNSIMIYFIPPVHILTACWLFELRSNISVLCDVATRFALAKEHLNERKLQ